jgi:hypothetical protein
LTAVEDDSSQRQANSTDVASGIEPNSVWKATIGSEHPSIENAVVKSDFGPFTRFFWRFDAGGKQKASRTRDTMTP